MRNRLVLLAFFHFTEVSGIDVRTHRWTVDLHSSMSAVDFQAFSSLSLFLFYSVFLFRFSSFPPEHVLWNFSHAENKEINGLMDTAAWNPNFVPFFCWGHICSRVFYLREWVKWPVEIDAMCWRMGGLLFVGKCDTVFRHTFRFSPCLISQHHMRGGICSHKHTDRHAPAFWNRQTSESSRKSVLCFITSQGRSVEKTWSGWILSLFISTICCAI